MDNPHQDSSGLLVTLLNKNMFSLLLFFLFNLLNGLYYPLFIYFLDNEPLTEGLSPINTTINNRISYTYQELVNHRFTWKDNGKKLRCVLQHDALGSSDTKEATIDLDISCEYKSIYFY